jgi:multiple sugar transport system substrate-binding protein
MRSTTRMVALAAAFTFLFVLAGCGSNAGSPAATGGPATGAPATGAATSAPATGAPATGAATSAPATGIATGAPATGVSSPSNLTGTLSVWAMGLEGTELHLLAEEFMSQNPGVTVNVTPVDWGQAVAKLQTAIAGNTTPDASQMGTDMMGQFGATGAFEPVPADIDPSAFYESAWNTNVVDGQALGVPWYVETRLLYYRTDIAETAGITAPPANWDELKAAAQAMKTQGGAEWGISLGTSNSQEYFPFLWSNGGDIVGADGSPALNSPQAVEALTFYDSFFEEGLSPTSVPEGFDITPAFVTGTHPMFFSGPWHLSLIETAGGADFTDKWAIAPMTSKVSATSWIGGGNFVVYKNSQNKDAAWAWVKFLTDPATQALWYETVGGLPAVTAAWEDPALQADPNLQLFGEQLNNTKAVPAAENWSELAAAVNDALEAMTTGDLTPQAAADQMQQQAESIGTD